jgi:hypothetical protein
MGRVSELGMREGEREYSESAARFTARVQCPPDATHVIV